MNFFHVAINDGAVHLGDQILPLTPAEARRIGDRPAVIFGIRPEHMRTSEHQASLTLTPVAIEPLGAHTLVLGQINDERVTAQVDPRFDAVADRPCTVPVDMTQAHFFDSETEQRL